MAEPAHSATERVAQHLARPIPDALRQRARLHLLDWLGCVAGARRSEVAQIARAAEPDSLTRAALLGNFLEMDDVHRTAILHPGPVIWPSVLSAVRETTSNMASLLDGAVRGYEAVIAIGETFDAYHYARWHNSSTAGGFGAAAAAASVFGLTETQTSWALGNVGSISGGLWHMRHSPGAMTKQLHIAHAALAGLWVARLARRGFVGPSEILEGPQGLYAAMTAEARPLLLVDGWRMEDVSFKPWPACRHAHPAIDLALQLKEKGSLAGPVLLETYADAVAFCDRLSPTTATEAKFSIQHSLAIVSVRGEPSPLDFEPTAISDPELVAARASIEVREAPDISARYPEHFGARITAGGSTLEIVDTLGDPERPLDAAGITRKARQLIVWGGFTERDSERAIEIALHGEEPAALLSLLEEWV